MSGDPEIIQLNCKPIATFFLWVTWLEISGEPWRFDWQPHITPQQLIEFRNRIHLTNPPLAAIYLNVFLSCTDTNSDRVMVCPGSEQVAGVASICLLHALSSLDPTSWEFEDICQRYIGIVPKKANFEGPSFHVMSAVHALLICSQERRPFEWMEYKPCAQERALFTNVLVQVAHERGQRGKVPRWVLRFSLGTPLLASLPATGSCTSCINHCQLFNYCRN